MGPLARDDFVFVSDHLNRGPSHQSSQAVLVRNTRPAAEATKPRIECMIVVFFNAFSSIEPLPPVLSKQMDLNRSHDCPVSLRFLGWARQTAGPLALNFATRSRRFSISPARESFGEELRELVVGDRLPSLRH